MAIPPTDEKAGGGGGTAAAAVNTGEKEKEAEEVHEQGGGGVTRVESVIEEEEEEVQATADHGLGGVGVHKGIEEEEVAGVHGGGGGRVELAVEDEGVHVTGEPGSRDGDEGDAHRAEDATDIEEEEDDEKMLAKLEELCDVLGSNYKEKLDEVGIMHGVEITTAIKARLLEAVLFLEIAKENRFKKMKESAEELLDLWHKLEQPTRRLMNVYQIFYIMSAKSSDGIYEQKHLSTALLKKIEKESGGIKSAMKDKYQQKKRRLIELIKELHLTFSDVAFDPKEKVEAVDYPKKIEELGGIIRKLKKGRLSRMQLVIRMELIETGRKEKLSVEKLKEMIDNAKKFVNERQVEGELLYYDGKKVIDAICEIEEMVTSSKQADTSESSTSSRSIRLENRLKKKAMDPSVTDVQEAATVSLNCPRKYRSGIQHSSIRRSFLSSFSDAEEESRK